MVIDDVKKSVLPAYVNLLQRLQREAEEELKEDRRKSKNGI